MMFLLVCNRTEGFMIKYFKSLLIASIIFLFSTLAFAADFSKRHDIFTPAFQLVWQDLKDLLAPKKINFVGIDPPVVWVLNANKFTSSDISDDSYYKITAPVSYSLKAKIQREIYEKFGESSKILDNIDWTPKGQNDYLLYALFKKDVEFPLEYNILENRKFDNSKDLYKFFGFNTTDANKFKSQVKPLFYYYDWDYAVSLDTLSGDRIILYRTDSPQNVYDLYSQLAKKTKENLRLTNNDELIVPFISLNKQIEYNKLYNKRINGTKIVIVKAIDDIEFSVDNKGAKVRNESAIEAVEKSMPLPSKGRIFDFSKPFVLFMVEKDKSLPYFAVRINSEEFLVK